MHGIEIAMTATKWYKFLSAIIDVVVVVVAADVVVVVTTVAVAVHVAFIVVAAAALVAKCHTCTAFYSDL